jgi:phospholipid/cholesterol/gamma-HCH transport system substrate-binding protein
MRSLLAPLLKVGLFVVVTLVCTALLAMTITNTSFQSAKEYKARFTDVTALNEGDDVRIAGVRVGQIETIDIVDRRVAEVTFSVDSHRRVPVSTLATVKYRNLVGQRYIALSQGAGDVDTMLQPGDTIPVEHTAPALNLTQLFNGFKPLFKALSPGDINKLSYEIIQVLQGEGGTIQSLLAHTASLTSTIARKDQVIGDLIDNLNSVLSTVNSHDQQLGTLVSTLQQLVSGLATDRQPIGDAISALADLTGPTTQLLDQARAPLKADIKGLQAVSTILDNDSPLVDQFLRQLPGKVATITPVGSYGSWFNFYLCRVSGSVGLSSLGLQLPLVPVPTTQEPPRCTS